MENEALHKILVPVDFSEVSDTAIQHAIGIAKVIQAELNLLHITQKRAMFFRRNTDTDNQLITEGSMSKLKEMAAEIEDTHGLQVQIVVVPGNIFDTISSVSSEINADFAVMGTHGMSWLQHLRGSNALRIIYQSPVPFVMTQKKLPAEHGIKKVVFPVDLQKESLLKTDWAYYFAQQFGSEIHVLAPKETDPYRKRKLSANLAYLKKRFTNRGVDYKLQYAEKSSSSLADETNRFANEIDADLIMIMIYPSKGAGEFFLTPSQQDVISNPHQIPVLCINPSNIFMLKEVEQETE